MYTKRIRINHKKEIKQLKYVNKIHIFYHLKVKLNVRRETWRHTDYDTVTELFHK